MKTDIKVSLRKCASDKGECAGCVYFNEVHNCKCYTHMCKDAANCIQELEDSFKWRSGDEALPRMPEPCAVLRRDGTIEIARYGRYGWRTTTDSLSPIAFWYALPEKPFKTYNQPR